MAFTTNEGRTQTALAEINMIPFIDIMLVLLIIFMITAPVIQSSIEVDVPRTQLVREVAEERLVVSIDKDQRVYLQNDPVNVRELGERIRGQLLDPSRLSVYLRADTTVPWGTSVTVLEYLHLAGIENVSIVTQPLDEAR